MLTLPLVAGVTQTFPTLVHHNSFNLTMTYIRRPTNTENKCPVDNSLLTKQEKKEETNSMKTKREIDEQLGQKE